MSGSRTLLIIEDDRALSATLELLLGKIGYSVLTAENGAQGIKLWEEEHPRAVLLDIKLPDMDGYEVCRQIKKNPARRYTTAVLFLSACDEGEIRTKGQAVCADYYIKKPVDPNDVGVDLYSLFEQGFNLEPSDIYRLRVTKQVPPNTDPHPFDKEAVEQESTLEMDSELDTEIEWESDLEPVAFEDPALQPIPRPEPRRPVTQPVTRNVKTQSSMQLDQVKDLLTALKESLGRTRNHLSALLNYIDNAH